MVITPSPQKGPTSLPKRGDRPRVTPGDHRVSLLGSTTDRTILTYSWFEGDRPVCIGFPSVTCFPSSFPSCWSSRMAAAVNCLVREPMRKRVSSVKGIFRFEIGVAIPMLKDDLVIPGNSHHAHKAVAILVKACSSLHAGSQTQYCLRLRCRRWDRQGGRQRRWPRLKTRTSFCCPQRAGVGFGMTDSRDRLQIIPGKLREFPGQTNYPG